MECEAALKVAEVFGGLTITILKLDSIRRERRDKEIRAECSEVSGTLAHSGGFKDKFTMIEDVVKKEVHR